MSDLSQLSFADSQSGDFPIDWTASVTIEMEQTHLITGTLGAFETISATMSNQNAATATGIGQAGIPRSSEQIIEFTLDSQRDYRFEGSVFYTNGGIFRRSIVELQFLFSFGWSNLFSTALPDIGSDAEFLLEGQLEAGSYRIRNFAELQNAANESFIANNEYTFTNLNVVPEPSSMLVLAGAGVASMIKRRRTNR